MGLLKTVKKETIFSRWILVFASGLFLFVFLRVIFDSFLSSFHSPIVYIFNVFAVIVVLVWGFMEGWFKNQISKTIAGLAAAVFIVPSLHHLLPEGEYNSIWFILHRFCEDYEVNILFPLALSMALLFVGQWIWERKKNIGLHFAFFSWRTLLLTLLLSISIYPIFATTRKCHGFFSAVCQQLIGHIQKPTLNGLEYMQRENSPDDAAIRFLNEHIQGQPCR